MGSRKISAPSCDPKKNSFDQKEFFRRRKKKLAYKEKKITNGRQTSEECNDGLHATKDHR